MSFRNQEWDDERAKKRKSCADKLKGLPVFKKILIALVAVGVVALPIIFIKNRTGIKCDSMADSTTTSIITKDKNSLMVLSGYKMELSYVLTSDGDKSNRKIIMPSSNNDHHYLSSSISALIQGEVYIFGGAIPGYSSRIAMVRDCAIKELDVKLNNDYSWNSAAVTTADQQSVLICFPENEPSKKCEEFDGTSISVRPATTFSHRSSCLALYEDEPLTVGSNFTDGYKKVEKFDGSSWKELPDHPKALIIHSCIGICDGILVFGGQIKENNVYYNSKSVYLLRNSEWSVVGELNEYHWYSSATRIGNSIYLVGGRKFANEKLEWDGEKISSKVIGYHSSKFLRPIIYPVDEFYCA